MLRLSLALCIASVFVSMLVVFLGVDRQARERAQDAEGQRRQFAQQLAERVAPMLERGDLLRLSMLATAARDLAEARVVVLDRGGKVALDTALVLGDRQLGLLTLGGTFQRTIDQADGAVHETLVPVRFGGEIIGEVRMQAAPPVRRTAFDFGLFALVLLGCASLVAVATLMAHHWAVRVRGITDSLVQLATGQLTSEPELDAGGELRELGCALHELEKGVHDGLHRVVDHFVAMTLRVVDGLERTGLVPAGHGERTARYAAIMAEKLELLPADRQDLDLACRVADVGKAWLRPALLQKREPLDDAEATALRSHPLHAAEHLECLPGLRRVATIVRHQGERQDGCGHPDALRGERIPIGARVLAIAKAFDLLTTCGDRRPLRADEALARMAEDRGEVYDPWLLDLFAAEIRQAPPLPVSDRPVMILPSGSMPAARAPSPLDEGLDYDLAAELEVMLDEMPPEEHA
ncbi:MAG: HD-GYP domain-containing protein [Planctomycetota bacterium]